MYNAKQLAENRINILGRLMEENESSKSTKRGIYECYGEIHKLCTGCDTVSAKFIDGNKELFSMVTDKLIYTWVLTDAAKKSSEFMSECDKVPGLKEMLSSMAALMVGVKKVEQIVGPSKEVESIEQLVKCIDTMKNSKRWMEKAGTDDIDIDVSGYFDDEDSSEEEPDGADGDGSIGLDTEEAESDEGHAKTKEEQIEDVRIKDTEEMGYDNPEIIANTQRVLAVYKDLFEVGFELKQPYGILVKEGILRLEGKNTKIESTASLARLYELINAVTGGYVVQSQLIGETESHKLRNIEMRKGTTYYPEFQLGNLCGILKNKTVDTWEELGKNLQMELTENIKHNLEAGKDISTIVDALSTCIVVSEFDPKVCLKIRMNIGHRLVSQSSFEREYEAKKSSILAGTGIIYHLSTLPSGVVEVILVFSKEAFNGRPLFAYEAVESQIKRGRKPSIREMILGQDTSGKIMTANLDRQNASIVLIGAGQRAGKGVLTLNITGSILADGNPLVYVDGKPDMAPVLWSVGRRNGVKTAVWDAFDSNGYPIGAGAPDAIAREYSDLFGLLTYLKVVQLMMVASHLRSTKGIQVGGEGKRPFFIFDEALAVQQALAGVWPGIIGRAKAKKDTSEEAEWCRHIVGWVEQLSNGLASTINSQLPKSGLSTIWLFQAIQPTTWNYYKTEGMYSSFAVLKHPLASRMSVKLLGRGTADSEYGLSKVAGAREIAERVLSDAGRHFAYTEAQKINDIGSVKVFKPYLVLNSSEPGSKDVNELMGNISKEAWDAISVDGRLPDEAGYEGFVNLLGKDAVKNLELGRQLLEEIMKHVGLGEEYSSIEHYLYDASPSSFRSLGALMSSVGSGETTAYNYADYGEYENNDETRVIYNENEGEVFDGAEDLESANEVIGIASQIDENDDNIADILSRYGESIEGIPTKVNNREEPACKMVGKDGRKTMLDTMSVNEYIKLNSDNCIDCRKAGKQTSGFLGNLMLNTPYGSQKYIDRMWTSILDSVVSSGYRRANITSVAMLGGNLFIGKKIVNLDGVLGGYEEIRLRDIVSFRILFNKFFMLRELIIDEDMHRVMMLECGETEQAFARASKLGRIIIQRQNGNNQVIYRDDKRNDNNVKSNMENKSKIKNNFDLFCAANRRAGWGDNRAGDNIWGMRLAKKSLSGAGKLFFEKDKPKVGRSIMLAGSGVIIATVGTLAWGGYRLTAGVLDLVRVARG